MTNINELLQDHVTLEVECLDRIYLNGYILTPYGFKVCRFFSRLDARVFRPAFCAMTSTEIIPYPKSLRKALDRVDREIDKLIEEAVFLKDAA